MAPAGELKLSDSEFLQKTAQWLQGDSPALAAALPQLYDDLRQLAGSYFHRENSDHTLQPTALVHEAYLRLREQRNVDWDNRGQFLAVAAKLMRRILLDHASARIAAKRGGPNLIKVGLDDALDVFDRQGISATALNEVLQNLEAFDPRQAQIVELRFFGGLTVPEIGEVLDISPATVKREWSVARLWLERELIAAR